MNYEAVIGLEVHVELKTKTKIFCGCSTDFGADPNSQVCPVCLGLPGTLPVFNKHVLEHAVNAGLATHCDIALYSKFDRKNYFYPDLSKAYQVSQFDYPIASNGYVTIEVDGKEKNIGLTRIHIEEDAGKLVHKGDSITTSHESLADYNRGGVPLIEIVSEPDIRSAEEARAYLEELRAIILYTGASDARMEEGSLRCDVNISLRPEGQTEFGTRAEIKNLNSFKAVERAIWHEIDRQSALLDDGERVVLETRTWDDVKGCTFSLRSKENADEYRYFPEPDIPPIILEASWVEDKRRALPEMPRERRLRIHQNDAISMTDAKILTASKYMADFYEETKSLCGNPAQVCNWLLGDVSAKLNADSIALEEASFTPTQLAELITLIEEGTISGKIAKEVFLIAFEEGKMPKAVVEEKGLKQISNEDDLVPIICDVIEKNPKSVEDYQAGKTKAFGFFVGQVMKATKGQANPAVVNQIVTDELNKRM